MACWYPLFEIEEVKQPALIAAVPTQHDPPPPLKLSTKRNHDWPISSTTFSTSIGPEQTSRISAPSRVDSNPF
jgi:hypothetical protein